MKAMVLEKTAGVETQPLRYQDVPEPRPGPGEVRVKVRYCAVCRTDLHIVEGELQSQKLPVIPGHQIVGMIDALGAQCHRYKLGTRVGVAWLRHTCGACKFCQNGQENLCPHSRFTGYHADGGYAEYAVVPEDYLYEIPSVIDDLNAAPLLCAGVIGYRAFKKSHFKDGGTLALFGFGSSAHIVIQIAKHHRGQVYVVTRSPRHQELARQLGACWTGGKANDMPTVVDSAILFAPVGELVPAALSVLEKGGTLSMADIYMTPVPSLDYEKHLFYEKTLCSVTANTREDGRQLLAEAAAIPIQSHTTVYSLRDANRALQDLKNDRLNGTAVLTMEGL